MSTTSTVEGPSIDDQDDYEMEDHADSASNPHDSSKEGEADDSIGGGGGSSTKPKRNRKSTQRLLDSFMDDDIAFTQKQNKKKRIPNKKMSSVEPGEGDPPSETPSGSEPSGSHEPVIEETEKERRPRVVPGKAHVQCTFMESKKKTNSQCKQRAIDGYLFCIWHILNDPVAPYKRCAHLRDAVKNGVDVKMQCKTAIRESLEPPFCLAHSGKLPKKRKRDAGDPSHPSPSSTMKESPLPGAKSSPSSPSSSIFNLPNDEFSLDIDEALDNLNSVNMESLMDTFDDFDSIDNLDDDEEEATVPPAAPLPFETTDLHLSVHERELMDDIVCRPFEAGKKLIERLSAMRKQFRTPPAFWTACKLHPDVPDTPRDYYDTFMAEGRFEKMTISPARKDEIRGLLADPELAQELALVHKYNTDLLGEMATLQRAVINSTGR